MVVPECVGRPESVALRQPIPAGTPDYRAMSVTVGDVNAAGGAVQVGDLIDVLFTFNFDPTKFFTGNDQNRLADFSSKIVLQNVPILARTATVYTIRTDAQTAEQIAYLTSAGGTMQFLLRAGQDQRQASTLGATFGPVYKRFSLPPPTKISSLCPRLSIRSGPGFRVVSSGAWLGRMPSSPSAPVANTKSASPSKSRASTDTTRTGIDKPYLSSLASFSPCSRASSMLPTM